MNQTLPINWGEAEQFRLAILHTIDGEKADDANQKPKETNETNTCITQPDCAVRL